MFPAFSYSKSPFKTGFTLIEILVVISIIAVLASVIISSLGESRQRATEVADKEAVRQVKLAMELYALDHGNYPWPDGYQEEVINSAEDEDAWQQVANQLISGGYIKSIPNQPQHFAYIYTKAPFSVAHKVVEKGDDEGNGNGNGNGSGNGNGEPGNGGGPPGGGVHTASSISQHGITWYFDQEYPVGQFANGDWWVLGPVTVTNITPPFTGTRNGWMVSPVPLGEQSFDSRTTRWNGNLVPELPHTAVGDVSLIKALSTDLPNRPGIGCGSGSTRSCIEDYSVLTVLVEPPPNNGVGVFRPPYLTEEKKFYLVDDIDFNRLPSLNPVGNPPSLKSIEHRYAVVQVDHLDVNAVEGVYSRRSSSYAANRGTEVAEAILRTFLNDLIENKKSAVIHLVQGGIDLHAIMDSGHIWGGQGGLGNARKLPIAYAAYLLNDSKMIISLEEAPNIFLPNGIGIFNENNQIYYGIFGEALYGAEGYSEFAYWQTLAIDQGNRIIRDPYHYIDGGILPGGSYQFCCNSMPWKYTALAVRLLNMKNIWHGDAHLDYADRWVEYGSISQPDACAPVKGLCRGGESDGVECTYAQPNACGTGYCGAGVCPVDSPYYGQPCSGRVNDECGYDENDNRYRCVFSSVAGAGLGFYGVDFGPDPENPGMCILDPNIINYKNPTDFTCKEGELCGRFPFRHGLNADQGSRESTFGNQMWDAYRF